MLQFPAIHRFLFHDRRHSTSIEECLYYYGLINKLPDNKKLDVSLNEKVKVYGNLQGGQERIFDGYVIKKPTGEQIIVTNPTPHFGFIIQSRFK